MPRTDMHFVCRIALMMGSVLTLTSCFNRLDTTVIEQEIEAEIESQSYRLSLAEVQCPRDVPRQVGAYFRCVGFLRPEGQFTINVTQRDGQGAIAWDVPSSHTILNLEKVEDTLRQDFAQAFAKRADLDCGEMYRLNQPGEQFECAVVGEVIVGQAQITALLVRVDPDGNLNWYEVREAVTPAVNVSNPPTGGPSQPAASTDASATGGTRPQNRSTPENPAGTRNGARPAPSGGDS